LNSYLFTWKEEAYAEPVSVADAPDRINRPGRRGYDAAGSRRLNRIKLEDPAWPGEVAAVIEPGQVFTVENAE